MDTKRCKKCGEVKSLDQFSMDKRWGTTRGACRECENIEAKRRVYARRATQEGKDARRLEVQRRIDSGWQERYKERRNRMNWDARMIVEGNVYDEKLVKMYRDAIDECNEMMSKIKKNKTLDRIDTVLDSFELRNGGVIIIDAKVLWNNTDKSSQWRLRYRFDPVFRMAEIMRSGHKKRVKRSRHDGTVTSEMIKKKMRVDKCPVCGKPMDDRSKVLDHIHPLAKGGAHSSSNLICICRKCNQQKRDKSLDEFIASLPKRRSHTAASAYLAARQEALCL